MNVSHRSCPLHHSGTPVQPGWHGLELEGKHQGIDTIFGLGMEDGSVNLQGGWGCCINKVGFDRDGLILVAA